MEDVQHNIDAQMNDVASDLTTDDLAERSSTIRRGNEPQLSNKIYWNLISCF